jgi:hypothetical protein
MTRDAVATDIPRKKACRKISDAKRERACANRANNCVAAFLQ